LPKSYHLTLFSPPKPHYKVFWPSLICTNTWNIWEKLCLLKVRHYRRCFRSLVPGGSLHLQNPYWGQVTKTFWAFYVNSEDLTRDLVVPCWARAVALSAPPKGGSVNIIWNLPQLFEMQGASYHSQGYLVCQTKQHFR
jgi:hypothetical protein